MVKKCIRHNHQELIVRKSSQTLTSHDQLPPSAYNISSRNSGHDDKVRPSHVYCPSGSSDAILALINAGASVSAEDKDGLTAHCGAAKGQLETLKLLHRKGADLWKRNVKGDLPLHEACQSGRKDLVLWLLSMRPDTVNAPNLDGRCPLHIAAINNNIEMCKILMDKQAAVNPIMRNSRGQLLTPLDAAVARSNRGCAKYLQLHGGVAASKLTDKHALQKAMQRALETSQGKVGATAGELTGDELMSSSASSVLKSNMSTMTASPVNIEAQTDTGDDREKLQQRDAQTGTSEVNIRKLVLEEEAEELAKKKTEEDRIAEEEEKTTAEGEEVKEEGEEIKEEGEEIKEKGEEIKEEGEEIKEEGEEIKEEGEEIKEEGVEVKEGEEVEEEGKEVKEEGKEVKEEGKEVEEEGKEVEEDRQEVGVNGENDDEDRESKEVDEEGKEIETEGMEAVKRRQSVKKEESQMEGKEAARSRKESISGEETEKGKSSSSTRRRRSSSPKEGESEEGMSEKEGTSANADRRGTKKRDDKSGNKGKKGKGSKKGANRRKGPVKKKSQGSMSEGGEGGDNATTGEDVYSNDDTDGTETSKTTGRKNKKGREASKKTSREEEEEEGDEDIAEALGVKKEAEASESGDVQDEITDGKTDGSKGANSFDMKSDEEEGEETQENSQENEEGVDDGEEEEAGEENDEDGEENDEDGNNRSKSKSPTARSKKVEGGKVGASKRKSKSKSNQGTKNGSKLDDNKVKTNVKKGKKKPRKVGVGKKEETGQDIHVSPGEEGSGGSEDKTASSDTYRSQSSMEENQHGTSRTRNKKKLSESGETGDNADKEDDGDDGQGEGIGEETEVNGEEGSEQEESEDESGDKEPSDSNEGGEGEGEEHQEVKGQEVETIQLPIRATGSRVRPKSAIRPGILNSKTGGRKPKGGANRKSKQANGNTRAMNDRRNGQRRNLTRRVSISEDLPHVGDYQHEDEDEEEEEKGGEGPRMSTAEERTHEMLLESSGRNLLMESGYSDAQGVERDSDVDGPTDPERHTEDEDTQHSSRRKTRMKKKRSKQREERQGGAALSEDGEGRGGGQAEGREGEGDDDADGDVEDDDDGRGSRRRRDGKNWQEDAGGGRGSREGGRGRAGRGNKGRIGSQGGGGGNKGGDDDDFSVVPEGELDNYYDDEDADEDALQKLGVVGSTHRRPGVRRGQVRNGAMSGGPRKVENMESNLKRRPRKAASPSTEVSITQAMQNTMRKYALERRLFQQLLDLKRIQIRNTRANEHVMIKRMVETFQKEGNLLGLRGYGGPYNFNSYEKYLYDQLRFLQSSQGVKIPAFRPTDDVERLSRAIRRAERRELPEPLMTPRDASVCNHTTHRCHHAAHAYTGVPCAAYS
ncbi:Ankyrin-2-like 7, partial [Homarus americanus]